jgi:hypothetical protein
MSGKNSRLNQLAARKQLLIVESELNRAQLVQEWRTLADEAHALADQAKTIRSMATATATLVAGLSSCRRQATTPAAEKPSWLQTLLKGAGMIGTFWQTFRAPPTEPNDP